MKNNKEFENLDYIKMCKETNEICNEYDFVSCFNIGKSILGKEIKALSIGTGTEEVLFAAAFHGSENITTNISLIFAERLCESIKSGEMMKGIDMKAALEGRKITVIPRVNPDGCDINILGAKAGGKADFLIRKLCEGDYKKYNANARGVDINHNFNAGWENLRNLEKAAGIHGPAATRFGGYSAESEPETRALAVYCRTNNIRHAAALHTQGEVIYWNYGKNTPEKSLKMAQIMASVSGYALDVPVALATGGGFKDYFIKEFRRPAFTLEMGKGKNPLPPAEITDIYAKAEEMLALLAIM